MPQKGSTRKQSVKLQILELNAQGKTYTEIQKTLGCSKGTIAYHLGAGQKEKTRARSRVWKAKKREERRILKNADSNDQQRPQGEIPIIHSEN